MTENHYLVTGNCAVMFLLARNCSLSLSYIITGINYSLKVDKTKVSFLKKRWGREGGGKLPFSPYT